MNSKNLRSGDKTKNAVRPEYADLIVAIKLLINRVLSKTSCNGCSATLFADDIATVSETGEANNTTPLAQIRPGSARDSEAGAFDGGRHLEIDAESALVFFARDMPIDEIRGRLKAICDLDGDDLRIATLIKDVMEHVKVWTSRPLARRYNSLHFEQHRIRVLHRGSSITRILYAGFATRPGVHSELLGIWTQHERGLAFWRSVLNDLKTCGVRGISTAQAGGYFGLPRAVQAEFSETVVTGPHHKDDLPIKPAISREDLTDVDWIGFGAAIEWIACRGMELPTGEYGDRLETALQELVDHLAFTNAATCEDAVQGLYRKEVDPWDQTVDKGRPREPGRVAASATIHSPVPHQIWRQVAVGDEDSGKEYLIVLVDHDDENGGGSEWGGEIVGTDERWTQMRVLTSFILATWLPGTQETKPGRQNGSRTIRRYSESEFRGFLVALLKAVPFERAPLSQAEIIQLCEQRMNVPRTAVRSAFHEVRPTAWPPVKKGPNRPRQPDRDAWLQEFGQKVKAAELPN